MSTGKAGGQSTPAALEETGTMSYGWMVVVVKMPTAGKHCWQERLVDTKELGIDTELLVVVDTLVAAAAAAAAVDKACLPA